MVKKIKVHRKIGKPKVDWKVIVTIIGVIAVIILILIMIGQAGLESRR